MNARVEMLTDASGGALDALPLDVAGRTYVAVMCRTCEELWLMSHRREVVFCPYCGGRGEPTWNEKPAEVPPPGSQHPERN